ncbi:hypothetical protein D3C87_1589310 [compost metagenome]
MHRAGHAAQAEVRHPALQQGLSRSHQHGRLGPNHRLALHKADAPDGAFGNPSLAIDKQGVVEPGQHRQTPRAGEAKGGGMLQMRDFTRIDLGLKPQRLGQW